MKRFKLVIEGDEKSIRFQSGLNDKNVLVFSVETDISEVGNFQFWIENNMAVYVKLGIPSDEIKEEIIRLIGIKNRK